VIVDEVVTATASNGNFSAWESVQIEAALEAACRSFSLTVAAEGGAAQVLSQFAVFAPVTITATGALAAKGYVEKRRPHLGAPSTITIIGSTKGADTVDCSCVHPTGHFKNKTPLQIAQALDKFGAGYFSDAEMESIKSFHLRAGESVHQAVERACRSQGLTLCGKADGSISITNAKKPKRHAGGLYEGVNITEADVDEDGEHRHSHVHVRGQQAQGHGAAALEIEGLAQDAGVPRYRPLIIAHDRDTDKQQAKGHAKNHRDRAAGKGLRCTVHTPSWRDEAGMLWEPGHLIWTQSAFLGLAQDMLIERIQLAKSSTSPQVATLHLVDPRAYGGDKGKRNKSGSNWNIDNSEAK